MIDFEKIDLLSYEITKNLSKLEIKSNGIYFTPIPIIKICIDKIKSIEKEYKLTIKNILEPCCGSCQFILMLDEHVSKKKIVGVEKNTKIIEKTRDIQLKNNEYRHVQDDFFHYNERENEKFDLIIGNPPFYVINKKNISEKYYKYLDGRPNIYNLFIIDCLKKLNKNGLLCFVLPTNFLNCLYYDTLRNYIKNKYKIHDIILIKENYFLTTKQDVFVLMIENKLSPNKNKDFCYSFSSNTIFQLAKGFEEFGVTIIRISKGAASTKCSGYTCVKKAGTDIWSGFNSLAGKHNASRRLHSEFNTDPETNNKVYRKQIDRLAYANAYTGTTIKLGAGQAGIDYLSDAFMGVGYYNNAEFIVSYEDAHRQRNNEKEILKGWGADTNLVNFFYKNKTYTKKYRRRLFKSLDTITPRSLTFSAGYT